MSGSTSSHGRYTVELHPTLGYWRVTPTPSNEEITRFYRDEFYSTKYQAFNNSALAVQVADQEFHDAHRQDLVESVEHTLGRTIAGATVLDIGCGWGQSLLFFKGRGAECFGFDPAPEAVAHARSQGLEVIQAGMDSMQAFGERRFDVVMLLNVLEHLADPEGVLRQIRESVLAPGGVLLIEVPNDFNAFQHCATTVHALPQWWVAPPAHLNYFSPSSLRAVVEAAGFSVSHVEGTFPLEMFLLFGDKYVGDAQLGRACHEKRMAFEMNLRRHGHAETLHRFYRALASENLGRQVVLYAKP